MWTECVQGSLCFEAKIDKIKLVYDDTFFKSIMEECIFTVSDTGEFYVTSHIENVFNKHGYIIVRQIFTNEEISNEVSSTTSLRNNGLSE